MPALLAPDELRRALAELHGWSGDENALRRALQASDFPTGIRLVDDVAAVAEELDHHPDIDIRWTTVVFSLTTHSAGGVTGRDVELARKIDEIAERHGAR
jgi:4a-hydroxytetrahydrobiopterin dehydratase